MEPPHGKQRLSRRLSQWLRERIPELLTYKCQEAGIRLETVNPWGTSSYCPRCGQKCQKVHAPNDFTVDSKGCCLHCDHCHFTVDRDYVGALNLYRVLCLNKQKKETLRTTSPLLYQRRGTPAHRPVGGPVVRDQFYCLRVTAV